MLRMAKKDQHRYRTWLITTIQRVRKRTYRTTALNRVRIPKANQHDDQ